MHRPWMKACSRSNYLTLAQKPRASEGTHLRTSRYSNWQVDSTSRWNARNVVCCSGGMFSAQTRQDMLVTP